MCLKLKKWIEKNEGLILLILLSAVLRIPSLFEPYWYGDEGIYLVLGQGLKKGLVFYRDIHDNKPPLLYLLAAVSGSVFYFRLMLVFWFGLATGLFYKLVRLLIPTKKMVANLATLAMIVLTTLTEGNVANAEIFIVLPVVAAVLIAVKETKRPKKQQKLIRWLYVGGLLSAGFLLKVPAGFDMAGVFIWLFITQEMKGKSFLKKMWKALTSKRLWLVGLGFLLPIVLSMVYYSKMGAGERYFRSALGQNIGYLSSWETGGHDKGLTEQSGLILRAVGLVLLLLVFYPLAKKGKVSDGAKLIVTWFFMALFGALLPERPYPHYLIQPIIPGSILIVYFYYHKNKALRAWILGAVGITVWFYLKIGFWHYPIINYYNNFYEYVVKNKTEEKYREYFDWRVNQTYKLAEYLKEKTGEDDRVFIWGDEPCIYALADRLPVGRYTVAYHVMDFDGYDETIKDFDKYKPKVVIVMEYETKEFDELKVRLETDYLMTEKIDQAYVYRRINGVHQE